jgi:hypothetical protein
MSWVWEQGPDDPQDRYVMLKLADNANSEGKCFPSMADICKSTKLSESTVRRCLNDLEKGSYLTVIKGVGRGHHSQYQLHKKVSEGKVSDRKVSEEKVSTGPLKGVTQTLKGVSLTEPPHPLIRVTVKNHQEPSGAFALGATPVVEELPAWVNADLWQGFVEMRRKMPRVPFTDRARAGILADLDRLRGWGIDANQRLDKATKHGWRGVLFDSDGPQQKSNPLAGMRFANGGPR